ncbi:MAG TPA: phosphoglycerate dehydrogenase [Pyrinomonadaceae bacterium]|nr:phosphoglycerate dehydrogenase [Pyrinomonadaceae bacterium]
MTWRVLISAPYLLPLPEEFRLQLESAGVEIVTLDVGERLSEADLLAVIDQVDGAVCGDDPFTEKVMRKASRLKVISKWGTGIDSIDQNAAAKLGIRVCNTPDAFTNPVADTTLGYILCFARGLVSMDQDIRQGVWAKRNTVALKECTLGVVGVGNIGKAVVRRARAFGMKVIGVDLQPMPTSFLEETGIEMMALQQLLMRADFVSLHCDLNPTSFHLIARNELALMRSSAFLINTARGSLIDESALVEVLRERGIAGVALDVFEVEPLPAESPLRSFGNCFLAPHNANSDRVARQRVHRSTFENLLRGLRELDDGARRVVPNEPS